MYLVMGWKNPSRSLARTLSHSLTLSLFLGEFNGETWRESRGIVLASQDSPGSRPFVPLVIQSSNNSVLSFS